MTDKEKIRKEIEKRYEYWKEKEFNSHSIESEIRMSECQHLLLIIDSLQEEPGPQFKIGDTICSKVWESAVHKIVSMDDSAYYFENVYATLRRNCRHKLWAGQEMDRNKKATKGGKRMSTQTIVWIIIAAAFVLWVWKTK